MALSIANSAVKRVILTGLRAMDDRLIYCKT